MEKGSQSELKKLVCYETFQNTKQKEENRTESVILTRYLFQVFLVINDNS